MMSMSRRCAKGNLTSCNWLFWPPSVLYQHNNESKDKRSFLPIYRDGGGGRFIIRVLYTRGEPREREQFLQIFLRQITFTLRRAVCVSPLSVFETNLSSCDVVIKGRTKIYI